MLTHNIVTALLSNDPLHYGSIVAGAFVLVCDIWLLLLHDTYPTRHRDYRPSRIRHLFPQRVGRGTAY